MSRRWGDAVDARDSRGRRRAGADSRTALETGRSVLQPGLERFRVVFRVNGDPCLAYLAEHTLRVELAYLRICGEQPATLAVGVSLL